MALSDDLASVTKYMLSLVEDPERLDEFRADPTAAIEAAELTSGAQNLLTPAGHVEHAVVCVVIVVIVVVVNPPSGGHKSFPQ